MGVRTTAELVAEVIEVDETISLAPFISAASTLVDRVRNLAVEKDLLKDGTESGDKTREEKLQEIETYLAAHFYTLIDPRTVTESLGQGAVSFQFQSKVDLRLFTSHYGQMACALDETGLLELINKGKAAARTVGVTWLGKTKEQIEEEAEE